MLLCCQALHLRNIFSVSAKPPMDMLCEQSNTAANSDIDYSVHSSYILDDDKTMRKKTKPLGPTMMILGIP